MFTNPGNKLQSLARLICTLTIIAGVIIGFVFFRIAHSGILFVLIVLIAVILGWISSIVLYTFGSIAQRLESIGQDTEDIKKYLKIIGNIQDEQTAEKPAKEEPMEPVVYEAPNLDFAAIRREVDAREKERRGS